ncbi:substrate-binding domain-containing protein [Paraburkholderia dipogonis]|uniref:substrate-binding domain-containing protein n=1 Tax=Paraburkholderia dipogonis TaxID=1211383 RepID=UPI0038BB2890
MRYISRFAPHAFASAMVLALGASMAPQAVVAADTFMPACYTPASASAGTIQYPARTGPYRVALVYGFNGIPWLTQMVQETQAWVARPENAKNIKELKVVGTGSDVVAQIAAIDSFIQVGYDAIVFDAVNPKAFDSVIRRAKKAGTVLVSFDNVVDSPDVFKVTPDFKAFGVLKTQTVIDLMPTKKGRLLEVRGPAGAPNDRARHAGAREVLDKYKDIQVTEVVGNWDTGTVQKVVSDAIAVNGDFDAIVCQHGCQGVTNALKAANSPATPVGGDAVNGFVKALVSQKIPGISISTSPGQGPVAVQAAIALLRGKALPSLAYLPPLHAMTRDMKVNVNYFPELPDSYETVSSYTNCGVVLKPQEFTKLSAKDK